MGEWKSDHSGVPIQENHGICLNFMKEKFYQHGLQFECTGCGNCCSNNEGYVEISEEEAVAIANFLKISEAEFLKEYVTGSKDHRWELSSQPNGDCIFLQDNRCQVYPVRPLQCRTFPFWKENLKSAYRWKLLAGECPGINQGKWHSREEIEAMLKLSD
ncbi:MAG: YkgJ family cysteine cluster protein [Calditrichaeota bacterium]|nr:MAG: YkgJ family cysteine cluster protein [Calditrichota bacterium]